MIQLLIIADDFTGALDSGVQLAGSGVRTRVTTAQTLGPEQLRETEVLVIDAETRHLPPAQAAGIVRRIAAQAVKLCVPHIYKKTDSALRGNIGAELQAVLEGSGETRLAFLPAFPQLGRCTVNGIHYIEKTPVAESVFGADPFEPVRHSDVARLIAQQSGLPVHKVPARGSWSAQAGIHVFDADEPCDLEAAGRLLQLDGALRLSAGCAGFAGVLPGLLALEKRACPRPVLENRLLVICGSVNPITCEQVSVAERAGFAHWRLTPEQKLAEGYWRTPQGRQSLEALRGMLREHPFMVIDSNDAGGNAATARYASGRGLSTEEVRVGISRALGQIVRELFASPDLGTLLITGGDTLLQCMAQMGVTEMEPICEVFCGVVLSRFRFEGCSRYILSKSGGFGASTLLPDLQKMLLTQEKTA